MSLYFRPCSKKEEFAYLISRDKSLCRKESWLRAAGTDDDDDKYVEATNKKVLSGHDSSVLLDTWFRAAVDRTSQKVYFTAPDTLVMPETHAIVDDIKFIIAHRLHSSTRTFDLTLLRSNGDMLSLTQIDRAKWRSLREWYTDAVYTWGDDTFQKDLFLKVIQDIPMPVLFKLLAFYSLEDMPSVIAIKKRDNRSWEDIIDETLADEAGDGSDSDWEPDNDDDGEDTEVDVYVDETEEDEDEDDTDTQEPHIGDDDGDEDTVPYEPTTKRRKTV